VTKQSHDLSNGYGIASSAFGLLAMTNGAFSGEDLLVKAGGITI